MVVDAIIPTEEVDHSPHPNKENKLPKFDPLISAISSNSNLTPEELERLSLYLADTGSRVSEVEINNVTAIVPKAADAIAHILQTISDPTILTPETRNQRISETFNIFIAEIMPKKDHQLSPSAIRGGCIFGVLAALHKAHQGQHYLSNVLTFANTLEGKGSTQVPVVIENRNVMHNFMGRLSQIEHQLNPSPDNPIELAINEQVGQAHPTTFTLT